MPVPKPKSGRIIGLEPGQPEYRILIVEDQEENWLLLQRLLESAGFQVQVAENGRSGIEKFVTWRPHFVWMDWRLPDMVGLEAAQRIRELDGGRDVKIVILSAFAFSKYRDEALAAGVDDFMSKPFQAEGIFECLARHLGVRYVYQAGASADITSALKQESLAGLPEELRNELEYAVISLDVERIAGSIDRISRQSPALGRTLSQYAERYEYSSIFDALRSSAVMQK
jgi:CheY-like chemotaxis protein